LGIRQKLKVLTGYWRLAVARRSRQAAGQDMIGMANELATRNARQGAGRYEKPVDENKRMLACPLY
jgi:hypothetical protein